LRVLLVLGLLLIPVSAGETATIAYTKVKDAMVVKARINGKGPFAFVLDTGAGKTVISPAVAKKVGARSSGKGILITGVAGQSQRAKLSTLKEFALGNAKVRKMEAVIHPIHHLNKDGIAGLLGQDFLDRFNMRVDIARKTLTLSLPGEDQPAEKILSPLQQRVQAVFKDPSSVLGDTQDVYDRLHQLTNNFDPEQPKRPSGAPQSLALETAQRLRTPKEVHRHFQNTGYPELEIAAANHMQRFLFCYGGVTRFLQAAANVADDLKRGELDQAKQGAFQASFRRLGSCRQ